MFDISEAERQPTNDCMYETPRRAACYNREVKINLNEGIYFLLTTEKETKSP